MVQWHFNELKPRDKTREAMQGEFFATEAIRNSAEALVREAIQNSLDAGLKSEDGQLVEKVRVRFHLATGANAASPAQFGQFFEGAWPHYLAYGILFRVRVTSPGTPDEPHGLLLAEADRIRLRGPEEIEETRDTILPVVPTTEIGDELWKVSFDNQRPRLLVNLKAGNYKELTLHPAFISLVYPAAIREVLWRIVYIESHRDYDDATSDYSRWVRFAVEVLAVGEPPKMENDESDYDDVSAWVDEAVSAFSRKHGLLGKFSDFISKEGIS